MRNDSKTAKRITMDAVALERVSPLNSLIYGHQLYKHLQPATTATFRSLNHARRWQEAEIPFPFPSRIFLIFEKRANKNETLTNVLTKCILAVSEESSATKRKRESSEISRNKGKPSKNTGSSGGSNYRWERGRGKLALNDGRKSITRLSQPLSPTSGADRLPKISLS